MLERSEELRPRYRAAFGRAHTTGAHVLALLGEAALGCKRGFLSLPKENLWEVVARDTEKRVQENTAEIGWPAGKARRAFGCARHAPAASLHRSFAPPNLRSALAETNPDNQKVGLPMMKSMMD